MRNDRRKEDHEKEKLKQALIEALTVSDSAAEDIRAAARRAGLGDLVDEWERREAPSDADIPPRSE